MGIPKHSFNCKLKNYLTPFYLVRNNEPYMISVASGEARGGVGAATFFGKLKKDFLISYLSKFAVNYFIN